MLTEKERIGGILHKNGKRQVQLTEPKEKGIREIYRKINVEDLRKSMYEQRMKTGCERR